MQANVLQAVLFTSFPFELGFQAWGPVMIHAFALVQGYIFQLTRSLTYVVCVTCSSTSCCSSCPARAQPALGRRLRVLTALVSAPAALAGAQCQGADAALVAVVGFLIAGRSGS